MIELFNLGWMLEYTKFCQFIKIVMHPQGQCVHGLLDTDQENEQLSDSEILVSVSFADSEILVSVSFVDSEILVSVSFVDSEILLSVSFALLFVSS